MQHAARAIRRYKSPVPPTCQVFIVPLFYARFLRNPKICAHNIQITDEIIKILINVFGEIQLDVSFTDSNSGNSGWADFRISENHEIEFIFEDDDDDDW